jgi:hypothetical protein
MVQPGQQGFTFQWSVPNMVGTLDSLGIIPMPDLFVPNQIPLNPHEIKGICDRLQTLPFDQATSTWPHRFIRQNAREILLDSMKKQLHHMGIVQDGETFRVATKSEFPHEQVYH